MIWNQAMDWHWLGTLAMVLFWALIIVLALAPIKYLRAELRSPELRSAPHRRDAAELATGKVAASVARR
ncbi:MAG TPA: hypothetical protein VJ654_08205 [Noviherbaspirillum sp.]|nr:hypothetical protein [Noviherbaspirillum sp.]